MTHIVQIGNSDNRLGQREWSEFIDALGNLLVAHASNIHFLGYSNPIAKWQNACVVFELREGMEMSLTAELSDLASDFRQDSIALTVGMTEFIKPIKHEG